MTSNNLAEATATVKANSNLTPMGSKLVLAKVATAGNPTIATNLAVDKEATAGNPVGDREATAGNPAVAKEATADRQVDRGVDMEETRTRTTIHTAAISNLPDNSLTEARAKANNHTARKVSRVRVSNRTARKASKAKVNNRTARKANKARVNNRTALKARALKVKVPKAKVPRVKLLKARPVQLAVAPQADLRVSWKLALRHMAYPPASHRKPEASSGRSSASKL